MKKYLLIPVVLMFSGHLTFAQLYNYKHYTVENGLPQSNADDIFQDKDGYILIATQNGAVKFDGFEYFLIDEYKGLVNNNVNDINQDSENRFWFSTKGGLTCYYNGKCINFTSADGLSSDIVINTFELPDKRMLICTDKGTDIYENNKIRKLSLKDIPVKFIKRKNGDILALTNKHIYKFIADTLSEIYLDISAGKTNLNDITEDKDSALWIAAENGLYKLKKTELVHFIEKDGLILNDIDILTVDSDNNLWYASERRGFGKFDGTRFYNLTGDRGMRNTSVLSLFEDKEKNIWIGGRNGAVMINPRIPFIQFKDITDYRDEIIMGISEDKDGNIWFCSYGAGLIKFDGKNFENYTTANGGADNQFYDAETDENGNLWFASAGSGLVLYDNGMFKKYNIIEGKPLKRRVLTLFKDSKKRLWAGTNGEGVILYEKGKFIRFNNRFDFDAANILSVGEDNDGNIWFATLNEGLFMFDGKKVVNIDKITGVKSGILRAIVNYKGNMIFGTASEGIFILKKENGKYIRKILNKSKGLNSDNIYFLYIDSKDNLWAGTEKGTDKIKLDEDGTLISVKNYTKSEGFLGVETDLNGVFEDRYGNIWFGTVNGIIKYNPLAEKKNLVKPAVYIKNIRLFFKDFDKKLYSDSVDDNNMPLNLVLPWNKNHITFDFIGLCYSNPEKVRYKYRLKGQNNEWSPPAADRKAVFTNIAPGKYTFEVTASNDDGLWADTPAVFTFTIEPPIWGRLWFKIGGAVLLFVLILILAEYRNRALKNAKNKLEKTVEERTSELKLQKEQLQKNNIRITDSINYAGKIQKALMPSHKFFRKKFPESFVVYKPKDIVSGDFYWAKEIRRGYDSYTVIVAADSTGHGIPGALVSMLGMSLLNEIVRKEEIKTANSILEELRKELKSSLNQKNDSGDRTEGIDMAVIMINDKTREMQYSGANSPLYVIRNGELILFEPTVNPVGVFLKELPFKNHLFQLMPGDMLYLFSDGFEDQFNGKTGEKFKLKRFRELLLKIYKKSCIRQKQILEKIFEDWKGDCEQIDDVLILGLRI